MNRSLITYKLQTMVNILAMVCDYTVELCNYIENIYVIALIRA